MAKKGQTSVENLKIENMLIDFMIEHKGIENAVSSLELAAVLADKGLYIEKRSAGAKLIKLSVERHLPICHDAKRGYYWAKRKEDLLHSVDDLQKRMDALQERINHLQSFIF